MYVICYPGDKPEDIRYHGYRDRVRKRRQALPFTSHDQATRRLASMEQARVISNEEFRAARIELLDPLPK